MKKHEPRLIAVDGVSGSAVTAAARAASAKRGRRVGVSRWDASGLFEQLTMAEADSGQPSARTLLLLYAADLAFRLRWEIEPALAEGKTVVAAPYVDTAIALGRSAGLSGGWLTHLFEFALKPSQRHVVKAAPARSSRRPHGFVEFACAQLSGRILGFTRQDLLTRARAHIAATTSKRC